MAVERFPLEVLIGLWTVPALLGVTGLVLAAISARRLGRAAALLAVAGGVALALYPLYTIGSFVVLSRTFTEYIQRDTPQARDAYVAAVNQDSLIEVGLLSIAFSLVATGFVLRRPAPATAATAGRGAGTPRPGLEPRPQVRAMLLCGVVGAVMLTVGVLVGCGVDAPDPRLPAVPGVPTPGASGLGNALLAMVSGGRW